VWRVLRWLCARFFLLHLGGRRVLRAARLFACLIAIAPGRLLALSPARSLPPAQVFFPLFANLKTAFDGNNSMLGLFCAGALAGSSAAGVVTPCDVVKTRLQVAGSTYKGVGDAFTRILREEGAAALFKGVQPRMLVQAPLFGITLGAFDVQKKWYAQRMEANNKVA
jgi:hypothetical protein